MPDKIHKINDGYPKVLVYHKLPKQDIGHSVLGKIACATKKIHVLDGAGHKMHFISYWDRQIQVRRAWAGGKGRLYSRCLLVGFKKKGRCGIVKKIS
jgi:hypothetical protein